MNLGTGALRSVAFVSLVFGSQAMIYAIRERRHLWCSCPSFWLVASFVIDVLVASILTIGGIAMTPLPALEVIGIFGAALAFTFVLDVLKVQVFARLRII
jgi:H+-transporting ATPase